MYRILAFSSLFLFAAAATAQPDRTRTSAGDRSGATMVIEYQDGTDLFRPAELTLTREDDQPLRPRAIEQIGILSKDMSWILLESFLSSGYGIQAQAMLPAPDAISMILIKPRRGPWHGWKVEEGEAGWKVEEGEAGWKVEEGEAGWNVEWTYFNQRGQKVEAAPCAPRACFENVVDAFNQAESTASSFRVEIDGFSFGVERE
ncbi:MAG: hypothetical protein AAF170_19335 [Bacteroidota bacterium]